MRDFDSRTSTTRRFRHPVLVAVLGVLILGSAGFAAAGGVGWLQSLFVTVEVDGQVVQSGEIVLDENGEATLALPEGVAQAGDELTITFDAADLGDVDAEGATATMNIEMSGTTDELNIQVIPLEEDDD